MEGEFGQRRDRPSLFVVSMPKIKNNENERGSSQRATANGGHLADLKKFEASTPAWEKAENCGRTRGEKSC